MDARYHKVAIGLHWLAALVIFTMLASGLVMQYAELEKAFQFKLYQWHKSLGVLFLWLIGLRLLWRIIHRPPALPDAMRGWEILASKAGHWLLYLAMVLMPLSGWLMVSSSPYGLPTIVFGWFEWPHLPVFADKEMLSDLSKLTHEWTAYALIALIIAHLGGVIKHEIIDKHPILYRMLWRFK